MSLQSEQIPKKQGRMAKDTDGNLVLVNPDGKAFAVDNDLSTVWLMLDGEKTYADILTALSNNTRHSQAEIDQAISEALERLRSVNLVEW